MARCQECGLVRSDPVASPEVLARLYRESAFTYTSEVESLKETYGRYLASLDAFGAVRGSVLDVGCGNGFFLEQAQALGYRDVWGVEPSTDAIAQAPASLQGRIKLGLFEAGLFEADTFDVICFFQVFDHFPDPAAVLQEAYHILKPNGLILAINHNIEALQARLLGQRSPIVDIEHTYLYSKATQSRLFESCGLEVVSAFDVVNVYPLHYWMQLFPLPKSIKKPAISLSQHLKFGHWRLALKAGNIGIIGRKPA